MNANEYLQTLWGTKPAGKILIWTLPDKHSYWYTRLDTVTQDFQDRKGKDVYTGMAMLPLDAKTASNRRVKLHEEIAGIPGLWVDVDFVDPVHKKKHLPPTQEDALTIIMQMPSPPTIVVESGHGLQALWLFEEPWLFANPEDQQMAANVCHWWHRTASALAKAQGWTIDSVFDLTRIMRVPGFTNNKGPIPKEVIVIEENGPRLDLQATKQAAVDDPPEEVQRPKGRPRTTTNESNTYGFTISADAEPPGNKLSATIENMPKFKETWEGNRKDLRDDSPSGYDMALASMAAQANWTDQEIVNLMIAFRRKHGHDPKLRHGYFRTTLDKARSRINRAQSEIDLTEAIKNMTHTLNASEGTTGPEIQEDHEERPKAANGKGNGNGKPKGKGNGNANANANASADTKTNGNGSGSGSGNGNGNGNGNGGNSNSNGNGNGSGNDPQEPDDANRDLNPREFLKDTVCKSLGFTINRILKYTGDPSIYWMYTDRGDIRIGKIGNITNANIFRGIVADVTGLMIQRFTGHAWDSVAQGLLLLCETVDIGNASFPKEETREWLELYLTTRSTATQSEMEAAIAQRTPFEHEGRIHILLDDFRNWVKHRAATDLTNHEAASRMHQVGAESKSVNLTVEGRRTTRYCWRLPQWNAPPEENAAPPEENTASGPPSET